MMFTRSRFIASATAVLASCVLAGSVHASAYSDAVIANGATSYWRLNDASGTTALATVGTNGTYAGTPTYQQSGATADGDKSMGWPGNGAQMSGPYSTSGDFTIEAWAKSATDNWNEFGWIASDRENNGFILHPNKDQKSVDFYVVDSTGAYKGPVTVTPTAINVFHQYVGTYNNTTGIATVYVDGGALSASNNIGAGWHGASTSNRVIVGADDIAGRNGNGFSDEVAIYPAALSEAQILGHFNAAAVPEPGTLGVIAMAGLFLAPRVRSKQV